MFYNAFPFVLSAGLTAPFVPPLYFAFPQFHGTYLCLIMCFTCRFNVNDCNRPQQVQAKGRPSTRPEERICTDREGEGDKEGVAGTEERGKGGGRGTQEQDWFQYKDTNTWQLRKGGRCSLSNSTTRTDTKATLFWVHQHVLSLSRKMVCVSGFSRSLDAGSQRMAVIKVVFERSLHPLSFDAPGQFRAFRAILGFALAGRPRLRTSIRNTCMFSSNCRWHFQRRRLLSSRSHAAESGAGRHIEYSPFWFEICSSMPGCL